MENFVGALMGIEPASLAFRAGVLTTTPEHHGTKCIKFASSNHSWQMVVQHVVITTVFSHCESATYTVVQALHLGEVSRAQPSRNYLCANGECSIGY